MAEKKQVSDLEAHLGYWMRFVSNHVSQAFTLKVESAGVTVAEWVVMRVLLRTGPVNPSQLAAQLSMTRGAVSKLLERLVDKEFVKRTFSEGDRRYQIVELTTAGRRLVPLLARLADENDLEFFGHLDKGTRSLLEEVLKDIVHRQGWKTPPTG